MDGARVQRLIDALTEGPGTANELALELQDSISNVAATLAYLERDGRVYRWGRGGQETSGGRESTIWALSEP